VSLLRGPVAMLALGATVAAFAVPFVCVALYLMSRGEPELRAETYQAGQTIDRLPGADGQDVWGQPADVDLDAVTCTGNAPSGKREKDLPVGPPDSGPSTVSDGRGEFVFLTRAGDDLSTTQVTCSGGGLESVATSDHVDRSTYRTLAFGLPVTIPLLLGFAWVVRRSSR
jgi:hypothetical protein